MRVSVNGKSKKPHRHKSVTETFAFRAAVLAFYDTHTMPKLVDTFWSGIELRSKAYTTKKRVILRWKTERSRIESMAASSKTANQKRFRRTGAAKTLSGDAEQDILDWVMALRSHGMPVLAKMPHLEALDIAQMYDVPHSAFAASPSWIASFLARHSLSLRTRTCHRQASPLDSTNVAQEFAATVRRRIVEEGITTVYNADQTAVIYEYVPKLTVDERGSQTVWVKCGGKSKERVTAMLMADSTGKMTREENTQLRQGFSRRLRPTIEKLERETSMAIFANAKGWWNSKLSLQFLQHHFDTRDDHDDPAMLIWDDFSAHWTAEVVQNAAQKNVILQRVPPGYTHCCQPADISWNKPLKDRMRVSWMEHLRLECARMIRCTENDCTKVRSPDRKDVMHWRHSAWGELSPETIKSGFKKIDLLFDECTTPTSRCVEVNVDSELVDTLASLECIDEDIGEVGWDDDVVDRYLKINS
ncbi:hypothetical protein PC120_g10742 [Phytophthora cactorum]|nr:hypothetical protein PC120_g10742 [Phytophthora cactorum]